MKILILDDSLERHKAFRGRLNQQGILLTHTSTAEETIIKLREELFDIVFLDHDLGDKVYESSENKNTGAEVARWLASNPSRKPRQIIIHSLNESGRKYIRSLLPEAVEFPFAWAKVKIK